jgi:transcriptional regulator with XRE-family HTH domain
VAKLSFQEKNTKKIAEKLKQLRIDKGYSSYENFAYENDLSRVQYWRLERGTNFTINYLLKVLEIHKISLSEFFIDIDFKP